MASGREQSVLHPQSPMCIPVIHSSLEILALVEHTFLRIVDRHPRALESKYTSTRNCDIDAILIKRPGPLIGQSIFWKYVGIHEERFVDPCIKICN